MESDRRVAFSQSRADAAKIQAEVDAVESFRRKYCLCISCGMPLTDSDNLIICGWCFDAFAMEPDNRLRNKLLGQYAIERKEVKA